MTLTPELIEAWTRNGIVSRFFPTPDSCEEVVAGHPDKVFIQVRTGELSWRLTGVRSTTVAPVTTEKPLNKRQQRYAQYE